MAARERKRLQDTCSHFLRSWRARHGRDQAHTHRPDAPNTATHRIALLPNVLSPPRSSSAAPFPPLPSTGISPIALRLRQPARNCNSINEKSNIARSRFLGLWYCSHPRT